MSVLAVTGLAREARIVSGPEVTVVAGGGGAGSLRDKIETAIGPETRGIISIGIAGALSLALEVGSCIVADSVVDGADSFPVDIRWANAIAHRHGHTLHVPVTGSEAIVSTVSAKSELFARTRALAVDMESHVAARVASARGLPFAVVRVISDRAADALPPAALVAMKPDGTLALDAVLRSVFAEPRQIPALLRTARDSEIAFAALLRCRNLLGPGLACPYLG